jgi:hypothetical protein
MPFPNFLYQSYQSELSTSEFWKPYTIEEIVQTQQIQPIYDISALQVDFWPEEETADDFIVGKSTVQAT